MNLPPEKIKTASGANYSLKDFNLSFTMGTCTAVYETGDKVPENQKRIAVVSEGIKGYSDMERGAKEVNASVATLNTAKETPKAAPARESRPVEATPIQPS